MTLPNDLTEALAVLVANGQTSREVADVLLELCRKNEALEERVAELERKERDLPSFRTGAGAMFR